MRLRILLVLSIFFFSGSGAAGQDAPKGSAEIIQYGRFTCSIGPEPGWVQPISLPAGQDTPPAQGVRYLLEDRQIRIGSGARVVYLRSVRELTSHQGVLSESELHLQFNPDYQRLTLHKVQVTREGETLDRLADAEIKLLQREEQIPQGIFTGNVSAVIILKDILVGDRLEFSYSVEGWNPVFGDKAFGTAAVGWGVGVGRARVRVLTPKARRLRTAAHNTSIQMEELPIGDDFEYRWQQDNTPLVNDEGDTPRWYISYPWVEYTEYTGWDEVERWAEQLYPADEYGSAQVNMLVARLKKESRGEADFIRRALRLVQEEIRYLGMEIGENSHRPHPPAEVVARRYGDCKDKARLLVALLRAGGIEAYPALVSAGLRGGVKDFLPAPGVFDHVIVAAKHQKQRLWLDGTRDYQRGELSRLGFVPYGVALVVGEDGSARLVEVEPLSGQSDRIDVTEHFQTENFGGEVKLTVVSVMTGGMAEYQRSVFANGHPNEITRNYLNFYARIYPGIESSGTIEYYDDEHDNLIKIVEFYRISDFWRQKEEKYLISDYRAGTIKDFTPFPKTMKRSTPLYLGEPVEASHRIVVDFPEDVNLNLPSDPLIYQDRASTYESASHYSGQRFVNVVKYRRSRSWIEASQVDEHLANLRKIADDINFSLTIPKPSKSGTALSYQRLLSRLAEIRKTGKLEGDLP